MSLNVVYPRACGVDVHKQFIVAVICISESNKPQYLRKRFSTYHNSLVQFREWLIENDCQNVCMESTGKYYIPVYNALEGFISNVVVADPKWVRAVKNEKDDNKDAKWIADLFKLGIVRGSFIPPKNFRVLRELSRYLVKLTQIRAAEKNRFRNALTVGNCKADLVFRDIFGKSATNVIEYILTEETFTDEGILERVDGRCKSTDEDILSAFSGIDFSLEQKGRMSLIKENINNLTEEINKLWNLIEGLIKPYEAYVEQLCTIPGLNRNSAILILCEIGVDMSQFASYKRMTAWAGLTPGHNESANKKKTVCITKAGTYLKPYLVEVAHAAVKCKKSPYYSLKFIRISKRRGKKRAIIAIARKILVAIYNMLTTGEMWNPADLIDTENPEKSKVKELKNNMKYVTKKLLKAGITAEQIQEIVLELQGNFMISTA